MEEASFFYVDLFGDDVSDQAAFDGDNFGKDWNAAGDDCGFGNQNFRGDYAGGKAGFAAKFEKVFTQDGT